MNSVGGRASAYDARMARPSLVRSLLLPVLLAPLLSAQKPAVAVYVLAGQSNMEGKAQNILWEHQATDAKTAAFFAPFRDDDNGEWIVRDDVFVDYLGRRGPLTLGFGSKDRTGLEFAFGLRVGDAHDEPVLLVKTAWGGRSLFRDFRPPSAGLPPESVLQQQLEQQQKKVRQNNEKRQRDDALPTMADIRAAYGADYRKMLAELRRALADCGENFPALRGREPKLSGFVWFQGWNDQYGGAELEYERNMRLFIEDVRRDLEAPGLPFVIGVMGQNGKQPAKGAMATIQQAQLAMQHVAGFEDDVRAVRTDELQDEAAAALYPEWKQRVEQWQKVGSDRPYHYLGSAIWYSRIGYALADAMLEIHGAKVR